MISKKPDGFVALLVVIVVGLVLLFVTVSLAVISIRRSALQVNEQNGRLARGAVESCLDEVLIWLAIDTNYDPGSIVTGAGTCSVIVTSPTGSTRAFQMTSSVGDETYGFLATINVSVSPVSVASVHEQL
ncbi:hypothetical protein COV06_03560 [Candidatus Uhrbacteria bacterium CG10_big_fil_rev_8_21_14_0_10_50_16]|uniref:Type 4 fimbrial biogenesis protein PilX N-terminal domain-containing protein n=1 Tax=Candidatus Uhrbacteria bacterium CG10_big_fil_rev_8_21_14_0_10_50_16 TaxID=1975039 RepID=A0A2H0RLR6_9BACT|nr:MAG: hypothetical protein COV06_03560 [Candidatus Uhrbacteria bacterium CG10_big_fil_rev_8_21_14_0_10_50_16]